MNDDFLRLGRRHLHRRAGDAQVRVAPLGRVGAADVVTADEAVLVPGDFDYRAVKALSLEARDKLSRVRPRTLGAAGRVPGITPADLSVLSVVLHRRPESRVAVAAG